MNSGELHIVEARGPRADECVEAAVTHARITGSVGASAEIGGGLHSKSFAKVSRVAFITHSSCGPKASEAEEMAFRFCRPGSKYQVFLAPHSSASVELKLLNP